MSFRKCLTLAVICTCTCLLTNCGKRSKPAAPEDTVPPAAVTDLAATPITHRSMKLVWTAPGDDGTSGQATRYDIHVQTTPFPDEGHFPPADTVSNPPHPSPGGQRDSVVVNGLSPATRYFFALRVADNAGLWSARSNQATNLTFASPDTIPPAPVNDLRVLEATNTTLTLAWTAPGDDGRSGQATRYDLRYGSEPVTSSTWAQATRVAALPLPVAAGAPQTTKISGLMVAHPYYFAIQAFDEAENGSALLPSLQAATSRPRTWRVREDRTGDAPTIQSAIDQAWWGDTVSVEPGRYLENIEFRGRDIVLQSVQGPASTFIDGSKNPASTVTFRENESRDCVLQGFTITGGATGLNLPALSGGGIACRYGSPTIRGNVVSGNNVYRSPQVQGVGGGLYIGADNASDRSNPLVEENVIESNTSGNGGGVSVWPQGGMIFRNNIVRNNTSAFDAGGVYVTLQGGNERVEITNNLFAGNVAHDKGGGLFIEMTGASGTPIVVTGNVFVRNESYGEDSSSRKESGGGIVAVGMFGQLERNTVAFNNGSIPTHVGAGGVMLWATTRTLNVSDNLIAYNSGVGIVCFENPAAGLFSNNLVWGNSDGTILGVFGVCPSGWEPSLLVADPLFCDPDHDDLHVAANSPALANGHAIGALETAGCAAIQR